jgi:hypothetical protein
MTRCRFPDSEIDGSTPVNGRGFTAPTALSVAALVVTHSHEPRLRDCARKVRENRDSIGRAVAVIRSGAAGQDHRRQATGRIRGARHRRTQVEARSGNHDRFVARV